MSFFAPAASNLWKQIESYKIDPEPLFREAGIDPAVLFDQSARIPLAHIEQLVDSAANLSGDENFGLKEADYFRPAHLGPLGFAWLASSSLRTAFARLSRYSQVINEQLSVTLSEDFEHFRVDVSTAFDSESADRIRGQAQMSILTKISRIIAGKDFNPSKVLFRHQEPPDTSAYYSCFKCPIEFGCESNSLLLPMAAVDVRLTGSNDQLAKLNDHMVVKYLAHNSKKDIVNRVKAAIIDGLSSGGVTETTVADSLHMTSRNMHRKLQKEDTTFKILLTEIRRELAQQYIQDHTLTLTEISFMLGFSEVSSFSRAYKGWTGVPPSEARQGQG